MNKSNAKSTRLHNRVIECGVFESDRPILLFPTSPPPQIATNALVAWNCSTEHARAAFAMALLLLADRATVLRVTGGAAVPAPSAEQSNRSLRRNDIPAAPMSVNLTAEAPAKRSWRCETLGSDLIVKAVTRRAG
jgi:hypothetical protein